jgi:hypothetical protein
MVKATYIVVENFKKWLQKAFPPTFDLKSIGIDLEDESTIRRFLEEVCGELTYRECLKHVEEIYSNIIKKKTEEVEKEARGRLAKELGTEHVSDAFKQLYRRYGENLRELFLTGKLKELEPIQELLTLRYGCVDYDIRPASELYVYEIAVQHFEGAPELFYSQVAQALGLRPAEKPHDLVGPAHKIAVGVPKGKDPFVLLCIVSFIDAEMPGKVYIAAHTSKTPLVVANLHAKKIALVH